MLDSLHGSDDEWQYICDLASYHAPYPGLAGMSPTMEMPELEVFRNAVTPMMHTEMEEADTDLVSYYSSPMRMLVAANRAYFDAFPDQEPGMYMLEWSFTPQGHEQLITWEEQVFWGVAWHRGIMGRYGKTEWAQQAHQRLWQFPEFRAMWDSGGVGYTHSDDWQVQVLVHGRPHGMTMENWLMYNDTDAPIMRSRGRLFPLMS